MRRGSYVFVERVVIRSSVNDVEMTMGNGLNESEICNRNAVRSILIL